MSKTVGECSNGQMQPWCDKIERGESNLLQVDQSREDQVPRMLSKGEEAIQNTGLEAVAEIQAGGHLDLP